MLEEEEETTSTPVDRDIGSTDPGSETDDGRRRRFAGAWSLFFLWCLILFVMHDTHSLLIIPFVSVYLPLSACFLLLFLHPDELRDKEAKARPLLLLSLLIICLFLFPVPHLLMDDL